MLLSADEIARALRRPHEQAVLAPEEVARVRQVLADCSAVLSLIEDRARGLLQEATWAATADKRSPGGLIYHVNLAIDYLDFAPAVRRQP